VPSRPKLGDPLSPREREVVALIGAGMSYQEIADHLGLSRPTVNTYTDRAYVKLGVKGRPWAGAAAVSAMTARGHLPEGKVTLTYTMVHRRILDASGATGLAPFSIRVLVALYERNGEATTSDLAGDLRADRSVVRHNLLQLEWCRYVERERMPLRKRGGMETCSRITDKGRMLAMQVTDETQERQAA
jgi:DNA-binding CsgD family transcriptional regulator/DNA-binding MarR family transcriptional regulator